MAMQLMAMASVRVVASAAVDLWRPKNSLPVVCRVAIEIRVTKGPA
jgi:hypothetical protein